MTKIIKLILRLNSRNVIIMIIWLAISIRIVHLQDAIIVLVIIMIVMMTLISANKNTIRRITIMIIKIVRTKISKKLKLALRIKLNKIKK